MGIVNTLVRRIGGISGDGFLRLSATWLWPARGQLSASQDELQLLPGAGHVLAGDSTADKTKQKIEQILEMVQELLLSIRALRMDS